ncbi:hypothetical protein JSR06_00465 [Candidatus Vidania fulgoroideae]|uniref:Uncharacterized protein n=1 Tax=Candidatus Vidania fulgoroideorum TaxID=881286 RepID=A0A974XAB9_9PROT|nr:hypothetical protein JSR06_00465 [Candidatus Vidania fulgoroideae]
MMLRNIKKLYNKEFFFLKRNIRTVRNKLNYRDSFACIDKNQATNSIIKALFYIRKYIYMGRRITIITSRKIESNILIKKLVSKDLLIRDNYIYYNGIINKEISKYKDLVVIVIGDVNCNFVKEAKKLGITSIYLSSKLLNSIYKPDIYVRCNTNSDISLYNILEQIYYHKKLYLLGKNANSKKNSIKRYFILSSRVNKYITLIGINFISDLFITKRYLSTLIKKIENILNIGIQNIRLLKLTIKEGIRKLELLYNEKIRIFSIKKIISRFRIKYYICNNKYVSFCFCKDKDKKVSSILMNIIAYKDVVESNILKEKSIFDERNTLNKLLRKKKHIKFFIIR